MVERPTLLTSRLCLRPFRLSDAAEVQQLAGDFEVARQVEIIPHPYPDGVAEAWIQTHADAFANRTGVIVALTRLSDNQLLGSMGLHLSREHATAELGYWIGRPFWGHGYATEAAQTLVEFGFQTLQLHRIYGRCFAGNPGSARVLSKVGMQFEGCQRQHLVRFGVRHDLNLYGLLRTEWESLPKSSS